MLLARARRRPAKSHHQIARVYQALKGPSRYQLPNGIAGETECVAANGCIAPRGEAALASHRPLSDLEVFGGRLASTAHHLVLDHLPIVERRKSSLLYRRDMDEDVTTAT